MSDFLSIASPSSSDSALLEKIKDEAVSLLGRADLSDQEIEDVISSTINKFIPNISVTDHENLTRTIGDELLRYGVLQILMDDVQVNEIMVSGGGKKPDGGYNTPLVFTERDGINSFEPNIRINSEEDLCKIVERLGRKSGRRCDEANPLMDAQLPDGSRVNAVHHSISIDGQTLNIRKFKRDTITPEQLLDNDTCSQDMMSFLQACVKARLNIVISGGTSSGKTTLLNVLSSFIPRNEHIVVIEDTTELQLFHPHIDRLQSRPKNAEGTGEITIHKLLINSLRMNPDRIIIGECRSSETIDMLQAMQTGHDGALTTIHSNSAKGVFTRIETMIGLSQNFDRSAIRQQIYESLDIVVQTKKLFDGRRIISEILSLDSYNDGVIGCSVLYLGQYNAFSDEVEFICKSAYASRVRDKLRDANIDFDESCMCKTGGEQ